MQAVVCQLQITNIGNVRESAIQRITHTADQQSVLDGVDPFRTFGMPGAHFMFATVGVGIKTSLMGYDAHDSKFSGNVAPWMHNKSLDYYLTSLTR
jgi:hypothetical protein